MDEIIEQHASPVLSWLEQEYLEAAKHLTVQEMEDFSVNKKRLTDTQLQKIEKHIKTCTRCRSQIGLF